MIKKRDRRMMKMLRRAAIDYDNECRAKFAAAVVIKGNIISLGFNQMKSHPLQAKYRKNPHAIFLHAEINALHKSLRHISVDDIRKATLYITRVKYVDGDKGKLIDGNAAPCKGCSRAIEEFDFKRVVHSTDENGWYEEIS